MGNSDVCLSSALQSRFMGEKRMWALTWKRKVWSWRRVFVAFTAASTPATATLAVPWSLQTLFSRSCILVSVKPGCRRWRCSTWRRRKVRSIYQTQITMYSLVTIFLKETECIMVAKIFKLDQSVLTPSLYNSLESTVEMSSVLELTRPENWNNLPVRILFWQILTSSPPWTHRWTRHKRLQWLACDGDRCSRCRRAALVWEKRSFKTAGFNRLYICSQILNGWFLRDEQ